MREIIEKLEECESQSRNLIRQGAIGQLEPVLRQWEGLLKDGKGFREASPDYCYYSMVFYQINGALYDNAGQLAARLENYQRAWADAKGFAEQILQENAEQAEERYLIMALNSGNFLRDICGILGAADKKQGLGAAETAAALYDWMWPVLNETAAKAAPEIHMNGFYMNLELGQLSAALAHGKAAEEEYRTLAARTGNPRYFCEGRKVQMAALLQKYVYTKEGIEEIEQCLEELKRLETHEELICRMFAFSVSAMAYAALGTDADEKKQEKQAEMFLSLCCRKAEEAMRLFEENPIEGETSLPRETSLYYLTGITLLGQFYCRHKRLAEAQELYRKALALIEQSKNALPPLALLKLRAKIFLEMGNMAERLEGDRTQAGFYYSQAAGLAQEALKSGLDGEALQTAVLGLYGAVAIKKESNPQEAVRYGKQGLELLKQLENSGLPGWSSRELNSLRKEFQGAAAEKKRGGFLSGLFGGKR